jgi:predicted NBD/HSP70 family sugar kinase
MAIAGLEGMRLVTPVGSTRGHIGRRAITYRLSPDARIGVGMDLGGTSLRSGLIDFAGEVRSEQSQLTPLTNFEDLVQEISNSIYTLKSKAKISKEIDLLVIGIPGVVNPQTGTVSMSPNVEYLNGLDLCAKLKDSFNCEVIIENDVNLAAIGEKESLKLDDFVFVSLGTGIGMALVLEGQLRRGSKGSAGEIGYMTFNFQEQNISKFTILENMVGGKALEAIYKKNTGKDCTMEDIFLFAQKGEKYAKY